MTKIKPSELFHGAALAQITKHDSFKALNKIDAKSGHYLVNTDCRLLTKHREDAVPWQFTFTPNDVETLKLDIASGFRTYLVLVCAEVTICLLDQEQIQTVLDLDSDKQQWIRVAIPGASMAVNGSAGKIKKKIPHKSFPVDLFEQ